MTDYGEPWAWQRLVTATICEYARIQEQRIRDQSRLFQSLVPSEERERREKAHEAERARLAEIERRKSPAQRRREAQARCHHDFSKKLVCRNCKMRASRAFVDGFEQGLERGREEHGDE